jgi:hypothetical protein
VKKVVLAASAPTTKPSIVSTASFSTKVARRVRVRLAISKAQAGPCYVKATSNVVRA